MKDKIDYTFSRFHRGWRPAMGWLYLVICAFDFVVAPAVHGIFMTFFMNGQAYVPWTPLTLQSGGLYHTAMLAVLGVTSWNRTKEKLEILKESLNNITAPIPTTTTTGTANVSISTDQTSIQNQSP